MKTEELLIMEHKLNEFKRRRVFPDKRQSFNPAKHCAVLTLHFLGVNL